MRGVDLRNPDCEESSAAEYLKLDLTNWDDCLTATEGMDYVFALAANTGRPPSAAASRDVEAAFQAYPELGEKFNPILRERDTIAAHQSVDRMVVFRFDLPFTKLENRTRLTLKIEDVTGPVLELAK